MVKELEQRDEEQLKAKARAISVKEGSAYAIMDGFGLRYIPPFAVAMGASNLIVGLISTLPNLLGNLAQLWTVRNIGKYSRKKIVKKSVFTQALLWLPLILVGAGYFILNLSAFISSILLLGIYSLIIASGSIAGPAWSSWMRDIVPERSGDYFGKRSLVMGIVALVSMLIAGVIIDFFEVSGKTIIGFGIIFFIAFMGRSISAFLLKKQHEPKFSFDKSYYFSLRQFVRKMHSNNFGKFAIFLGLFNFAVSLSSPFFAVFMLKDYGFDKMYLAYTIVSMSSVISTLLVIRLWGKFIDKYGNVKVIRITSLLISAVPFIWILSYWVHDYIGIYIVLYLILAETFSGIVWAGFNLATGIFLYEAVTKQRMAICVTYNGIISSSGALAGALLGGYLSTVSLFGIHSLILLFAVSGLIRLVTSTLMSSKIKEVRSVEQLKFKDLKRILRYSDRTSTTNFGNKGSGLETEV